MPELCECPFRIESCAEHEWETFNMLLVEDFKLIDLDQTILSHTFKCVGTYRSCINLAVFDSIYNQIMRESAELKCGKFAVWVDSVILEFLPCHPPPSKCILMHCHEGFAF